jgi:amino acid transporter
VVTPLVWSLPVALAMSELASAMPDEGGYVTWVERAFGRCWAFQVGWWSWIDSFVDVAVSFTDLIVLNIWLYCLSLLVELAAFAWLRLAAPDLPRPWRVPGGAPGAVAAVALPAACCLLAMATAGWLDTAAGVLAALSGLVAYRLLRRPAGAGDDTLAGERGRAWEAS